MREWNGEGDNYKLDFRHGVSYTFSVHYLQKPE